MSAEKVEEEIKSEYAEYFRNKEKITEELKKDRLDKEEAKKLFDIWRKSLSEQEKRLVDYIQGIILLRDKRKDIIGKGLVANFIVGEYFFKKLNLDKNLIYYCAYEEFLKGTAYFESRKAEIAKRPKGVLFLNDYDGTAEFQYDNFAKIRKAMEEIYLKSQKKTGGVLKGAVAYPGFVRGKARIILQPSEFGKFKKRNVLVTSMTRPEFIPIMKIASAIITDEGGITCHAAIVAREMRKPCIIGTKIATQVLKDGDSVEVDAEKGVVTILKRNT
jgi:phosphoenolpyruvate synthase/pyruvate phosphate dikinase